MPDVKDSTNARSRKSASAEAALRAQQERIDAMSIEERVKAALSMRERFGWLRPVLGEE